MSRGREEATRRLWPRSDPPRELEKAVPVKRTPTIAKTKADPRTCRVLLVQAQPTSRRKVQAAAADRRPMSIDHAASLADARQALASQPFDLAVIASNLPDGDGTQLVAELYRSQRTTATVVLAESADFAEAQRALRAGADEIILAQAKPAEFTASIEQALDRKLRDKAAAQRIDRLHRLCRKLNDARVEVSKQVDILCNDLVTAYQELACQMQNVVQSTEYTSLIDQELNLESLLRQTLEHLMTKLGPANAAIFLPANHDEYSLGGYVNYDCTKDSADLLLEQLGDELAPKIAEEADLIHLTEARQIERWVGESAGMLDQSGLVAVPCVHDDECLAVLVFFRDTTQPFTEAHLDRISSLAPALAAALQKIIKVHHRMELDDDLSDDGDSLTF